LLTRELRGERVRTCEEFLDMLDIVTMDESAVSFHMLNEATVKAVDE
jgi:hypothetical protein